MWNCNGWLAGIYPSANNFFLGFGHLGWIMGLLFMIILATMIYKLFGLLRHGSNATSDQHDSFMILKSRFARGEISLEEYQRMKNTLLNQ